MIRTILVFCLTFLCISSAIAADTKPPLRIGWIGALTGPTTKYGSYQSAQLAVQAVNETGGVRGRELELIAEDGQCNGRHAASAAQKLIQVDKVDFILGGHCSSESVAIAPLAERSKVLMLAATTSSPKLTSAGDYIFRLTTVNLLVANRIHEYIVKHTPFKRLAIIHEETEYAAPPAELLHKLLTKSSLSVPVFESFHPGETDFRAILVKAKSKNVDAVYLGVQAPDTADLLLKQMRDLSFDAKVFGNEIVGNTATAGSLDSEYYQDLIFAEPDFSLEAPKTREFVEKFKAHYKVDQLPAGYLTAEPYDSVILLAKTIERCGFAVDKVKDCLYEVKEYQGVSGKVSIDSNGDALRTFLLKQVNHGNIEVLQGK